MWATNYRYTCSYLTSKEVKLSRKQKNFQLIPMKDEISYPIWSSNYGVKILNRVSTFYFNNHMYICIATYETEKLIKQIMNLYCITSTEDSRTNSKNVIFLKQTQSFTFEIILQFMHHFSIFHKWNCIKINFVVHTKLDIFPVLLYRNIEINKKKIIGIRYAILNEDPCFVGRKTKLKKQPVMEGNVALLPRTFKWRLDFNSPPSITSHLTVSTVFDLTARDIIPPIPRRTWKPIKLDLEASNLTFLYISDRCKWCDDLQKNEIKSIQMYEEN